MAEKAVENHNSSTGLAQSLNMGVPPKAPKKAPVNAGADNNQEIVDFDRPLTVNDIAKIQQAQREFSSKNEIRLTAKVVEYRVADPKPAQKKDGDKWVDKINDAGEVVMKDPVHYATITFMGGEMSITADPKWELQLNCEYQFIGRYGVKFGSMEPIFTSIKQFEVHKALGA